MNHQSGFISLVAVTAGLLCASAAADEDNFRGTIGLSRLLGEDAVRKHLRLSDAQSELAMSVAEDLNKVRDGKAQSQAKGKIQRGLSETQWKRLKQIQWQLLGGEALFDQELSGFLDVTDAQKKLLSAARATNAAEHKKMLNFMSRARFRSRQAMEDYKAKFRDAGNKRLMDVLTQKQRDALQTRLGALFELE